MSQKGCVFPRPGRLRLRAQLDVALSNDIWDIGYSSQNQLIPFQPLFCQIWPNRPNLDMVVPKETWFGRPLAVTHRLWTADRRDELPHSLFPIHNDASHLTSITFRNCLTRRHIPIPFLSSFDWRRTTVAFAQFASFNPSEFSFRTHSPLNLAQHP